MTMMMMGVEHILIMRVLSNLLYILNLCTQVMNEPDIVREDLQALLESCHKSFLHIQPLTFEHEEDVFDKHLAETQ